MSKYKSYVIRGTLNWAKVLGSPVFNEYAAKKQWSVDVTPDEEGVKTLKKLKLDKKLKTNDKNPGQGRYIAFRLDEFKKDGSDNAPVTITDIKGNPWPSNKLIGNGTVADVKFSYADYGTTQGNYIKAIRVLKHVPYIRQEFDPIDETDQFFDGVDDEASVTEEEAKVDAAIDSGEALDPDLDDDVPF